MKHILLRKQDIFLWNISNSSTNTKSVSLVDLAPNFKLSEINCHVKRNPRLKQCYLDNEPNIFAYSLTQILQLFESI